MHWIREHPYLTGSLVLVAIILFVIVRRAGGSASAPASVPGQPSESLLGAQLAASTQIQGAQIAATAAQNQVNAQLAAVQVTSAADVQKAQLAETVALQNIVTSGNVADTTAAYNLEGVKAQTGAQVSLAALQEQGTLGLAQIQTSGQVTIAGQAAQVNEDQIRAAEAEQASINATQLGLASISADVAKNTVNRQADIAYTELTQSGMTTRAGIAATQAVDTTSINAAKDVAIRQTGATVQLAGYQQNLDLQALADKYGLDQSVISGLNAGQYGNPNRAALASNIIAPGTGGPIAVAGNAQSAGVWGSFWNFAKSAIPSLTGINFGGGGGGSNPGTSSSTISYDMSNLGGGYVPGSAIGGG